MDFIYYWVCVARFVCLLLPLYACKNNYEQNAWNKIIIIIIIEHSLRINSTTEADIEQWHGINSRT